MQTTFVVTILVGAPVVAVASSFVTLDTWGARAVFAVRVGAPIWFLTAITVAIYARRTEAGDGGSDVTEAGAAAGEAAGDEGKSEADEEPLAVDDESAERPQSETGGQSADER